MSEIDLSIVEATVIEPTRIGLVHGLVTTYSNDGCRCAPCKAVWAAYQRHRRELARVSLLAGHRRKDNTHLSEILEMFPDYYQDPKDLAEEEIRDSGIGEVGPVESGFGCGDHPSAVRCAATVVLPDTLREYRCILPAAEPGKRQHKHRVELHTVGRRKRLAISW